VRIFKATTRTARDGMNVDSTTYIIDRITAGLAVLEPVDADTRFQVPVAWLPAGSREGDVVTVRSKRGGARAELVISRDDATRREREARLRAERDALPRGPEGDIEL
jgi:hypothetical protein